MVEDKFEVKPERQILFFQGTKMEEDRYTMDDYGVRDNNKIQLLVNKPTGSQDYLPQKGESTGREKAALKEGGGSGSRESNMGAHIAGGRGGAGESSHLVDGDSPMVGSSRPNGRARPKTKQAKSGSGESGEQEQEARGKRVGGEDPEPRTRADKDRPACMREDCRGGPATRGREEEDKADGAADLWLDSVDDILEDSQEGGKVQEVEKAEGGARPPATNEDSMIDAPSRETQKEEGPVKEKADEKAGHAGRPGGHPGDLKEGMGRENHPTEEGQLSAQTKKQRREDTKTSLQDQKETDSGGEPRPGRPQEQGKKENEATTKEKSSKGSAR